MRRPAFQFYPADWRGNANLRRCSEAARGAWMDILCTLHDSDEYGLVRWPLVDLARAAGVAIKLVMELASKSVLKGSDKANDGYIHTPRHAGKDGAPVTLIEPGAGPCWYSSRMVRDEWHRSVRGGATRFTPDSQPTRSPNRAVGDGSGDGASTSSASAKKKEIAKAISPSKPPNGAFEAFWVLCPRKVGKGAARKAYSRALLKTSPATIDAAMARYAASRAGEPEQYTVHPATWLNEERWADETMSGPALRVISSDVAAEEQANLKRMGVIS